MARAGVEARGETDKRLAMEPRFPLILIQARDWNLYKEQHTLNEKFEVSEGWLIGFLIEEKKDSYIVAAEYFPCDNDEDGVRYIQAIPKETVIFKKIINIGRIKEEI